MPGTRFTPGPAKPDPGAGHDGLVGTVRRAFCLLPAHSPGAASSYQVIYHFTGKNGDGAKPIDNVIIFNGLIYGMTVYGGTTDDSVDGKVMLERPNNLREARSRRVRLDPVEHLAAPLIPRPRRCHLESLTRLR